MKQKGARMMPNSTDPIGFETDIKPMFRERDRTASSRSSAARSATTGVIW
jgi:hypothetical protein